MALLAPEAMDGLGLGLTDAYLVAETAGSQLLNLPWASSAVLLLLWIKSAEKNAPEALKSLLIGILAGERAAHCVDASDKLWDFSAQSTDLVVVRGLKDIHRPLEIAIVPASTTGEAGLDPTILQSPVAATDLPWQQLDLSTADRAHARSAHR